MSVRESLQAIYDARGALTPALVVAEASSPDHPLHARFVWDDTEAARRYREVQAAGLIRSVKIKVVTTPERDPILVRAFISRSEMEPDRSPATGGDGLPDPEDAAVGQYQPVEEVVQSDILRTAWFRGLERDWQALRRRAGASREFAALVLDSLRDDTA